MRGRLGATALVWPLVLCGGCGDDGPPTECTSSTDCPMGERCVSGSCRPAVFDGAIDSGPADTGAADTAAGDSGVADTGMTCPGGDCETAVIALDGAGVERPCALRRNGELLCVETSDDPPVFTSIGTFAGATDVVRGSGFTCLLFDAGDVHCLSGDTFNEVSGLTDAVQIDTWVGHVCAARATGEVVCWGDNSFEQIEAGGESSYSAPHPIAGVADVAQVATSRLATCALHRDGTVSCWGSVFGATPTPVAGVTGGAAITAGHFHYCVTGGTGDVQCFGDERAGTEGMVPSPITDAAEAIAFHSETCYRSTSGSVFCWGAPSMPGQSELQALEPIVGLDDARLLANHCALRATGVVSCWGDDRTMIVDATGL